MPKENILGKIDGGGNVLFDALNPECMVAPAGAISGGCQPLQRGVDYAYEIDVQGLHRRLSRTATPNG